ncbi:MAG: proline racemase family protein [Candidatus Eisenbacteria bacterium]
MLPPELEIIDSHTEGEPTRVIVRGGPELRASTMLARREEFSREHDDLRRAVVLEPRGHEAIVAALLTPPVAPESVAGVIFWNNVGCLGMCGHGLIGVARTLELLGNARPGEMRLDTPVGTVGARLHDDGSVTVRNVAARVAQLDLALEVPGLGRVTGDIAWGGNWFFLVGRSMERVELDNLPALLQATQAIKRALWDAGIRGDDGGEIDHVELFSQPRDPAHRSRNFVLCPGGAYDRSPCGTGTSAKLAVLHARGEIALDEEWTQESVTDGLFRARLVRIGDAIVPEIRGRAFITARSTLLFDPRDPLRAGLAAP